ncbi:formyltetrahydrofolate deformylase, partial [Vibrio sp. Vb0932]|nr:formyltetrahydrofolate deformylase [Vibrio sp. Vb0932]
MEKKTLLTHCSDAPGLISKMTHIGYKHQLNTVHNNE